MKPIKRPKSHADKLIHAPRPAGGTNTGAWMTLLADRPGTAAVSFDAQNMPRADRVFPADCASAVAAHGGAPELQFVQLSRRSNKIQRMVAVRYERTLFLDRIGDLADFHGRLKASAQRPEAAAAMRTLFAGAQGEPPAGGTLVLDADVEWMMHSGSTAAVVFLRMASADRLRLSSGQVRQAWLEPEIEITLTAEALVGLLDSWQDLAMEMRR